MPGFFEPGWEEVERLRTVLSGQRIGSHYAVQRTQDRRESSMCLLARLSLESLTSRHKLAGGPPKNRLEQVSMDRQPGNIGDVDGNNKRVLYAMAYYCKRHQQNIMRGSIDWNDEEGALPSQQATPDIQPCRTIRTSLFWEESPPFPCYGWCWLPFSFSQARTFSQ